MMPEQGELLLQARESLAAARLLHGAGHFGFAASRAYYSMFYVTEALLLSKGQSFSKHSAVHAAFGEQFAKTGLVPVEFHRYLIRAIEVRHAGDYGGVMSVTPEEAEEQLARAEQFLQPAERLIGPIPDQPDDAP